MRDSKIKSAASPVAFVDSERKDMCEGYFAFKYRDDNGEWVQHFERKNMIVNLARKTMAHAISDEVDQPSYIINQFRLGGNNNLSSALLLEPARPQPDDAQLVYGENLFVRNKGDVVNTNPAFVVSYPESPNETSVMFEVLIGKSEANVLDPVPTVYVAAGLFTGGGAALFASQTFPVITKTPNREFLFQWSIRF